MASLPPAPAAAAPQPAMAQAGGNVEAQPNGDTAPAEPAQPSDASGAAGGCAGDQMVQKIEEVLSGALGTELQSNPDVDKNTVKNSTQSTKRSSTGEDEIPRKKAKKNKKHKSKKKKKKKKKRKKEKKHKKQPKEAKLGARPGEAADVPPAPHLLLEKSGPQVNVQQGGVGDPSLAGHLQPQLCPAASEGLDNQALGLVSHPLTDSQQSAENLGSGDGTLCAANPPFILESNQCNIPENSSITPSTVCTSEEQIQQAHGNIYAVAINASVVDTGNDAWSSIPSGIASKSEFHKDSVEALRGSEVALKSPGTGEVKALDTALEPEAMEVLPHSEASLQSVSQRAAQDLGTASVAVSLASGGAAIPASADWADPSAVTAAHVAVAGQGLKIPEATEKCLHMGNVQSVQRSLELGSVSRTLEPAQQASVIAGNLSTTLPTGSSSVLRSNVALQHPFKISAVTPVAQAEIQSAKTPPGAGTVTEMKDIEPAMENVKAAGTAVEPGGVTAHGSLQGKAGEGSTAAAVLEAAGPFLPRGACTEMRGVDRAPGPALPAGLAGASAAAEPGGVRAASEPAAPVQTLAQQTAPQLQMAEGLQSLRAPGSEGASLLRPEGESNVRALSTCPVVAEGRCARAGSSPETSGFHSSFTVPARGRCESFTRSCALWGWCKSRTYLRKDS
ncbi:protein SON isoform X4 [Myiozetetes cayanensis]|uniref:protein SON isoform X4 n=1 Tax=Myiozetetes cayanensis TaxID=478635 RepID=UPI00215E7966|nr:protein SON isoform X4 [Myiozetetes cayanensis]